MKMAAILNGFEGEVSEPSFSRKGFLGSNLLRETWEANLPAPPPFPYITSGEINKKQKTVKNMTGTEAGSKTNGSGIRSNGTGRLHFAESIFSIDPSMHEVYRDMGSPFTTGGLDDIAGLDTPEDFAGYTAPEGIRDRVARHHLKSRPQHDKRTEKEKRGREQPLGFEGVKRYTHALAVLEEDVDQYLREEKTGLAKVSHNVRSFVVGKVLGRRLYTIDELFALQLQHAGGLEQNLDALVRGGREALRELVVYSERTSEAFYTGLSKKQFKENELALNVHCLQELEGQLRELDLTSPDYFPIRRDADQLRRQLEEEGYVHQRAMRRTENAKAELEYLTLYEQLFRVSTHVSETAREEAKALLRHIQHTRQVYFFVQQQLLAGEALTHAADILRKATHEVDKTVQNGLKEIATLARKIPGNTDFYVNASEHARTLVDGLRTATTDVDSRYGAMLDKYIAEHRERRGQEVSQPTPGVYVRVPGAN